MTNNIMLQLEEMEEMITPDDSTYFWGVIGGSAFLGGVWYGAVLFT
ncbi:hypothetical protein HQN87_19705 [Paenibacillus tritici]|uniref:Uncharacterized protein n=1 Tax=Paenibacillus tritici TaxID=1873425 RepID=A0ABX2DSD7_9BACL|nr:hypothetical protein [Paenibacillus tritici]NQX47565.1 hypothetical protein [Paenibacillus tritici]